MCLTFEVNKEVFSDTILTIVGINARIEWIGVMREINWNKFWLNLKKSLKYEKRFPRIDLNFL